MKQIFLAVLFPVILSAQTAQQVTEQLGKSVEYDDVALSPDTANVAWVQSTVATTARRVCIRKTSGNATAATVQPAGENERVDSDPAWSPDSKTLAFFSTAGEKEQAQLWTVGTEASNPRKRTHLKGYAAHPRWSHDGKQIAFLYIENAGGGGPLMAAPSVTGVIDTAIHNQRIAVLDVATGGLRQVSPPDLHIYDYNWSPDDKTFVATAAFGPGDNNWWIAQLYTIDIANGKAKSIYKPSYQIAIPRWSPDGKSIAFIEGIMSDEGFHSGDLFTINVDGTDPMNRIKGHNGSVSSLFWQAPEHILFTENVGGGSALSELTLADNSLRTLWKGAESIHAFGNFPNFDLVQDGKFAAAARSDFETPTEIWAGPVDQWHKLTSNNASLSPTWGKAQPLEWPNEGFTVQGWMLPPKKIEAGKRYPLVVLIHGGPTGAVTPEWPSRFGMVSATLASHGYFVLMPNPRGSTGQGENFARANVKDFGGGDLRDILAGVDAALAHYPIDPARLGVTGWSYGGYMTMWTVTQTDRFHAAVAGAGIANWQSYYGQNRIDQWMIPFFGASVYDNPEVYEKSSPIRFIKNVKTPTLVLVGEHDAECPTPQSFEFWHALRTIGATTQLVVYAGEGHFFMKPENRIDRMDRTVAWFDKYLK